MSIFRQTARFAREVMGLERPSFPTRLDENRKRWFIGALEEEVEEFRKAETIEDEVDAICDLIYFAAGRLHEMGVSGEAHFQAVHDANMLKEKGELSKRPFSKGYDAVKPEGWEPPDHAPIIRAHYPNIILLGHARHGKDTVAEYLRDRYGFAFQSSSMFCAERVMMPYFDARVTWLAGPDVDETFSISEGRYYRRYRTVEECYEDRVNFRDVWYDEISRYNAGDKGRLARELFEENDIYVGLRAADELVAAREYASWVLWVDASRRMPPEPASSCTVTEEMTHYTIDNNGTLEELHAGVDHFVRECLS